MTPENLILLGLVALAAYFVIQGLRRRPAGKASTPSAMPLLRFSTSDPPQADPLRAFASYLDAEISRQRVEWLRDTTIASSLDRETQDIARTIQRQAPPAEKPPAPDPRPN